MAQKVVVLGLWSALIALSFLPGVRRREAATTGLMLPVVLLAWVALSVAWSNNPASSAEKVVVLLFTTFGTWRLATIMRADELFSVLTYTLSALVLGSMLLVFLVPSIGILNTWQHAGQWSGMFISKQTLGTVSALLVCLSMLRLIGGFSLPALGAFSLAAACVIGSGSRGGAILAGSAVACVLVARRSPGLAAAVSILPLALLLLACSVIAFLVWSGLPYLPLFGQEVNLTERTLIWQYALGAWTGRSLVGFGINGLWTDPDVLDLFLRRYGWVLDNYHSGYVAALVEYGLFGFAIFAAYVVALCCRLGERIRWAPRMPPRERQGTEAMFGFVVLCFTINLTETFFFRGTDFTQVTLTFVTIQLFAIQGVTTAAITAAPPRQPPAGWPARARRRAAAPLGR
jgi:O-antigen ligase